ncbi:hypothetical protein CGLO_13625 [Colletotrichum gloeosporioides Cg-14]|uniref:Uncharacterized protein n=1 Tax=Colletotrichum gloeosporioides (strain Cg-14) TaxID=1237896 RepID=T0L6Q9_COLGC|nr:hypothetical protein CGLO_13625 [Colletotrichum gloeosporioides Cg-14]
MTASGLNSFKKAFF